LNLIFRDESDEVARKANTRNEKKQKKRTAPTERRGKASKFISVTFLQPNTSSDESGSDTVSQPSDSVEGVAILHNPCQNVDDLAISIFLRNYVISPSDISNGHLNHLPSLYNQTYHQGVLPVTISAVGLALMSNIHRAPEIMAVARKKYATAVKMTNTALQCEQESKADSTLMAVILLGMFEVSISCPF
jgi:hypothetical protein